MTCENNAYDRQLETVEQDPTEKRRYAVDFTTMLAGASIVGPAVWTITPDDLQQVSQGDMDPTIRDIVVTGGTADTLYRLSCKVVTDEPNAPELIWGLNVSVIDKTQPCQT